jgi:hypothetical protein
MLTRTTPDPRGRRNDVPRWATVAAVAVPLCVLPSAVWRIGHVVHVAVTDSPCHTGGAGELVYVAGLSVVSMAAALLALGLVRPWGEVVPRRLPVAGGKPVPVRGATIAASAGATVVALITGYAVLNQIFGFVTEPLEHVPAGCGPPGTAVALLYAPLVAWAPLVYVLAFHYRRRRGGGGHSPPEGNQATGAMGERAGVGRAM